MYFPFSLPLNFCDTPPPPFVKGHSHCQSSFLFSMRSAFRKLFHMEIINVGRWRVDQPPDLIRNFCWRFVLVDESYRQVMEYIRKFSLVFFSSVNIFEVSVVNGNEVSMWWSQVIVSMIWRLLRCKQDKELKFKMRNFWAPLLNRSSNCHADVIAGRQNHQKLERVSG